MEKDYVLMKRKDIIFKDVFKVRISNREQTLHTPFGDQDVKVGDYLFEHPDGTVSRVHPEYIGDFEEVEVL